MKTSPVKKKPLAELRHVSVTLQGIQALKDISLSIYRGESCALIGPNGSGKSTLLKVLRAECFADGPSSGKVFWYPDGTPDEAFLAGRELCSLVSTAHAELYLRQKWRSSGEELIISGLYDTPLLYCVPSAGERKKARTLAAELHIKDLLDADISGLSQVQLNMLLFARACIRKPGLLLLDEFVDGLDARYRAILLAGLDALSRKTTLLIATHRPENLPCCVRRVIRMADGKITAVESFDSPPASAGDMPRMQNRAPRKRAAGRPVFRLRDVTVYVAGKSVLSGINWEVYPHEHWTLVGGAGSGKSTLLRLLAGDHYPAAGGDIRRVSADTPVPLNSLAEIRRHIRLVSGDMQATYAYDLSGEEFVCSGSEGSIGIYHHPDAAERAQAHVCLAQMDASHLAERRIRSLSTGQLRRLVLARALAGFPKILLLDDPFAGLDENSRMRVRNLLQRLAEERKIQIIMTASSPRDQFLPASRVAVLKDGRLREETDA